MAEQVFEYPTVRKFMRASYPLPFQAVQFTGTEESVLQVSRLVPVTDLEGKFFILQSNNPFEVELSQIVVREYDGSVSIWKPSAFNNVFTPVE